MFWNSIAVIIAHHYESTKCQGILHFKMEDFILCGFCHNFKSYTWKKKACKNLNSPFPHPGTNYQTLDNTFKMAFVFKRSITSYLTRNKTKTPELPTLKLLGSCVIFQVLINADSCVTSTSVKTQSSSIIPQSCCGLCCQPLPRSLATGDHWSIFYP